MARRLGTIGIASALSMLVWQTPAGLKAWGPEGPGPRPGRVAQQTAVPASTATLVCSRSWVGREQDAEAFLKSADIARVEEVPIGVTRPKRAFFTPGGPVRSVAWKPLPPGRRGGFFESYKSEIAAYELDKLLDMRMVPPVVEREHRGETGAAIWWIEPANAWKADSPARGPEPDWSKQVSRMKLFDQLIANIDRNQGNLLYDSDWHLMLIDHSRAFTDRRTINGIAAPARIDRALWERIDKLTANDLERSLGAWLSARQLEAILVRRDRMRSNIARMVRSKGEAVVFFN